MKITYCSGQERSRPSSCRVASTPCSVASGPASSRAGSPGIRRSIRKITIETPRRMGTRSSSRLAMNSATSQWLPGSGTKKGFLHRENVVRLHDHAARVAPDAGEVLCDVEENPGCIVHHDLLGVGIGLLPFAGVCRCQAGPDVFVDLGIVVERDVEKGRGP